MTTTRPAAIPDAALDAAYDSLILMKESLEWGVTHDDAAKALTAAYPHIRAAILAEVEAVFPYTTSIRFESTGKTNWYYSDDDAGELVRKYTSLADLLDAMKEATDDAE